jgi:hypothetical protein
MNSKTKKILTVLIVLIGIVSSLVVFLYFSKKMRTPKKRIMNRCLQKGLSLQQAKIVAAISAHETGNYVSELALKFNNYFGMGVATKRETTAKGYAGSTQFASFSSLESSVDDFLLWFKMYGTSPSEKVSETVNFMKEKGYFADTIENYQKGVTYFFNLA